MNYYRRHIGDYIRDTAHLSLLEHGIYGKLLDVYYAREAPIPVDQAARLVGAKGRVELQALNTVLAEFFERDGAVWRQARCDREIAEDQEFRAKQAANGRASGAARRSSQKRTNANPETNHRSTTVQPPFDSGSTKREPPTTTTREDSEGLRPSAVPASSVKPENPDPRKALFDIGRAVLGKSAGGMISEAIKRKGEPAVAAVLGEMAVTHYADPRAYFVRATQVGHDRVVV